MGWKEDTVWQLRRIHDATPKEFTKARGGLMRASQLLHRERSPYVGRAVGGAVDNVLHQVLLVLPNDLTPNLRAVIKQIRAAVQ